MTNKIEIYDNEVPFNHIGNIYECVKNSNYRLGWADRDGKPVHVYSAWTKEEAEASMLTQHLKRVSKKSKLKFNIDNFSKCIINLGKCGDYYFNHTHGEMIVLLYYVNLEWKDGYAGETLFYDNTLTNVEKAISFVPGRIVIFDGECPHTIRPQSTYGPDYRFTISYEVHKEKKQ